MGVRKLSEFRCPKCGSTTFKILGNVKVKFGIITGTMEVECTQCGWTSPVLTRCGWR